MLQNRTQNQLPAKVFSANLSSGVLEWKHHENGSFDCTANRTQKARTKTEAADYKNLRPVRREFPDQGKAQAVLQHPLFGSVAKCPAKLESAIQWLDSRSAGEAISRG